MTDDGRAGHHFARAGWNFAEELVKETGAKKGAIAFLPYLWFLLSA